MKKKLTIRLDEKDIAKLKKIKGYNSLIQKLISKHLYQSNERGDIQER